MGMRKRAFLFCALAACALAVSAQSYSLRSNILGLATTNLNLEASMTLNRKWSLHLPVQYNPFKFGSNRQFRNFYAAPGARYWLLESYMGGFIGMYGTVSMYSVGNLFGSKYRYEGEGYGVGLSVGKAYQISGAGTSNGRSARVLYGWLMTNTCANAAGILWTATTAGISFRPVPR